MHAVPLQLAIINVDIDLLGQIGYPSSSTLPFASCNSRMATPICNVWQATMCPSQICRTMTYMYPTAALDRSHDSVSYKMLIALVWDKRL